MAFETPVCNDSQWDLLRKILLSLPSISGGGGGGGDVFLAGNNTFTGNNTFNGPFLITCTIDGVNRELLNSLCNPTVDWENLNLKDAGGGFNVVSWGTQELANSAGTVNLRWGAQTLLNGGLIALNWNTRILVDSGGVTFIDWENGTINGLVYPLVDGAAGDVVTTDGAGNLTLQPATVSALQSGSEAVANGTDTVTVVFPSAFVGTPSVVVTVSRPLGEFLIYANIDDASLTATGFTASLSGTVTSANYKLKWMANE